MLSNPQNYDKRRYQKIASLLKEKKNGMLLDVGCGNGAIEYHLKSSCNFDFYGFDKKDKVVALAKQNLGNPNYIVSDGNKKFPYEDNTFDVVLCIGLLEHIEDPHNVVKECLRVMKPDGIGIINTPNAYQFDLYHYINKPILPEKAIYYFTPNVLTGLIKRYGGHIDYINMSCFIPFNLNFRRIYVKFSKELKKK